MALAHTIGNKVEAAYRRGDLLAKRVGLIQDWAEFLSINALCRTEENRVYPFRVYLIFSAIPRAIIFSSKGKASPDINLNSSEYFIQSFRISLAPRKSPSKK